MAEVVDIVFIDENTGKVVQVSEREKKKWKKWLLGILLPVGAFVVGFFEGAFTGGGFRVNTIKIKYIDPRTGKQLNS